MAPHPSLAYCEWLIVGEIINHHFNPSSDLTGSLDGSVTMWEFGIPRPVAMQRQPGMGGSVTKIRFTSEGNKVYYTCMAPVVQLLVSFLFPLSSLVLQMVLEN